VQRYRNWLLQVNLVQDLHPAEILDDTTTRVSRVDGLIELDAMNEINVSLVKLHDCGSGTYIRLIEEETLAAIGPPRTLSSLSVSASKNKPTIPPYVNKTNT
jgi:hypothetical protein